jgi:hypothetical protein
VLLLRFPFQFSRRRFCVVPRGPRVLGAPSVSFGDGLARHRRRLVFVLRWLCRVFVSGWFFISGRFAKSVKVGIHRRGVCGTALTRVLQTRVARRPAGFSRRHSHDIGAEAPTPHGVRAAEYASRSLYVQNACAFFRTNSTPPRACAGSGRLRRPSARTVVAFPFLRFVGSVFAPDVLPFAFAAFYRIG